MDDFLTGCLIGLALIWSAVGGALLSAIRNGAFRR